MPKQGVEYVWIENLGGFRQGGYKKYVKTKEWEKGFDDLLKLAAGKTTAIMCAELVYFRCHRRYIADALKRKKFRGIHVYDENMAEEHFITRKRKKIRCD